MDKLSTSPLFLNSKSSIKCTVCEKILKPIQIIIGKCKCAKFYCNLHIIPDKHECQFDYYNAHQIKLTSNMPVIKDIKMENKI